MLVRVLEIPPSSGGFCFGSGNPQTFVEVDWFRDETPMEPNAPGMMETEDGRKEIAEFVKAKNYFDRSKSYLVLHPSHSFTINYAAP